MNIATRICKTCNQPSTEFYAGQPSCIPCVKLRQLKWYEQNKARNYANSRASKITNPERTRAYQAKYRELPNNKERQRAHNLTRIARQKNAEGSFTPNDIRVLFGKQGGCCPICGTILLKYHIDHIFPLSRGGSNWPTNLQLLCPPCNIRKGAKIPNVPKNLKRTQDF